MSSAIWRKFGARLRTLRRKRKWSQEEFAYRDRHGRELPERTGEWKKGALSNPDSPHCQRFWPQHFRVNERRLVLKFAAVAVGVAILERIDNHFPSRTTVGPKTRSAVQAIPGPKEIAIHLREAGFWPALPTTRGTMARKANPKC
jgi:hypothetical protein